MRGYVVPDRRRRAQCRVCRQSVDSELCVDVFGTVERVIMPHNNCVGRFKTVRLLPGDMKLVEKR